MGISFDSIPEALRIPFIAIEFSNRLAGNPTNSFKTLVPGIKLASGTLAAGEIVRVNDPKQLDKYFGQGSMLAEMGKAMIKADPYGERWFIGQDEPAGGQAATSPFLIAGPATSSGTLFLYIAGYRLQIGIQAADTADEMAVLVAAAINNYKELPITAAVNGVTANQVDITCKWKSETGNDIDIRINANDGEELPDGVSITITAMSGGTGNPDITDVFTADGDEWYNWQVMPFTDAANLTILETELNELYGPMKASGRRAFAAYRGTHAETGTFGNGRNNPHLVSVGTNKSLSPPWIWSATIAAVASASLQIDPARQLKTLALPGIKPAKKEQKWTSTERNQLLLDGIATHTVDRDGTVRIERLITMYQTNASGFADDSYLDVNTPETLERIRFEQRAMVSQKFPRHKLADNDYEVKPGQATVTPNIMQDQFLVFYKEFEDKGWVQDYNGYKETIHAEIHADDPNRLDLYDSPKLVSNLRVTAVHTEFRR
jgi:phage tail sheath gpL-like